MSSTEPSDNQGLTIHLPEALRAGVYASLVNINVRQSEVVMDFIMVHPRDTPEGTLVSRVILSRVQAKEFADTLRQIVDVSNEVSPE